MTTISVVSAQPAITFQYCSDALLSSELMLSSATQFISVTIDALYGHHASAGAVDNFIHLFNLPTVPGSPVLGDLPLVSIRVPPQGTFSFSPPNGFRIPAPQLGGGALAIRVWWAVSSTDATYTASLETFWINASGRAARRF